MQKDKDSTAYIFKFALILCLVSSVLLALVSEGLRPKKELNESLDVKKNYLKAVALVDPIQAKATAEAILGVYNSKIKEIVIDANGEVVEGKAPLDIKEGEALYPLYIYSEGDTILSYAYPIVGKGLWSTLYGYLALENDAKTIRGITFYKHGETPGLGAEIDKDWFQDNFKGKLIWDVQENILRPTAVIKGNVSTYYKGDEAQYYVDGISGATMTARGVTEMVGRWVNIYEPYFLKIRK